MFILDLFNSTKQRTRTNANAPACNIRKQSVTHNIEPNKRISIHLIRQIHITVIMGACETNLKYVAMWFLSLAHLTRTIMVL